MENGLNGRVAVITGASSGIGAATARALAAGGARVALLARRKDRIDALADELGEDLALACVADVTDRASLDAAAEQVGERLGRADILVNNAGQMLLGPVEGGKPDEWRRMVEINLTGAMETTDAFLPQLTDGGGDIVNVSSVAGRKARTGSAAYSATKWGLNGWSEALRQELLEKQVRVIVVEPGAVETELVDHISDEAVQSAARQMYEDVEALAPDDIARAVAFAVAQPPRVSVNEILIRPTKQAY